MLETNFVKLIILASNDDMSTVHRHTSYTEKKVIPDQILRPFFFLIPINRSRLQVISATSKHLPCSLSRDMGAFDHLSTQRP